MSNDDARIEAESLGIRYSVLAIEPAFEAFSATLADSFAGRDVDLTEENLQSRCRGVMLMALSNKFGHVVLTTGNKSEMAVGYATLYGDMCGGFAPIKDVYKTLVYDLCRYRNTLGAVIPERVLTRPPSAELRADQKDSDSLPPYEVLDPLLQLYVEQQLSIDRRAWLRRGGGQAHRVAGAALGIQAPSGAAGTEGHAMCVRARAEVSAHRGLRGYLKPVPGAPKRDPDCP